MSIVIYHNPACGTSRNTLAMIRQSGEEPEVIEYLKTSSLARKAQGVDRGDGDLRARIASRKRHALP